jgi:hypothetical protein
LQEELPLKKKSIGALNDTKEDEENLKEEMGEKYGELNEMVDQLKSNLKRVAQLAKNSRPLDLRMQHAYQYSKWDTINEPYNIVENVLKDDDTVYKAL